MNLTRLATKDLLTELARRLDRRPAKALVKRAAKVTIAEDTRVISRKAVARAGGLSAAEAEARLARLPTLLGADDRLKEFRAIAAQAKSEGALAAVGLKAHYVANGLPKHEPEGFGKLYREAANKYLVKSIDKALVGRPGVIEIQAVLQRWECLSAGMTYGSSCPINVDRLELLKRIGDRAQDNTSVSLVAGTIKKRLDLLSPYDFMYKHYVSAYDAMMLRINP